MLSVNEFPLIKMKSIEFAIHEGAPHAIDFVNPVPDLKRG
jgi:hypothetical protein